jgi:hypothetical protein
MMNDEGEGMFVKREIKAVFLIALLCFTLSLTSSTMAANTHLLPNAAERNLVGGYSCDSVWNGVAVGMGIATLFGCVFCSVGSIGAKAIQFLAC